MTCNTVKKESKEMRRVRRGFADPEGPEGFANTEGFADTENPEGFATPRARRNRGFAALRPCGGSNTGVCAGFGGPHPLTIPLRSLRSLLSLQMYPALSGLA